MIYLIALIVAAAVVLIVSRQLRKKREYALLSERVHGSKDSYAFLIDRQFKVKETNFYELNDHIRDDQPYVLGNVLQCQNACDSGLCGTGMACAECPIRMVINNSFREKRNFDNIAASMHLYDDQHQVRQVDVIADGELVSIGDEPHFFITVRKVSNN